MLMSNSCQSGCLWPQTTFDRSTIARSIGILIVMGFALAYLRSGCRLVRRRRPVVLVQMLNTRSSSRPPSACA